MTSQASRYILVCLAGISTVLPSCSQTQKAKPAVFVETPEHRDARTKWFRDAKFGMFIHWGVYSQMGKGEWIMHEEKIQVPEYEKLYPQFNPVRYDPAKWVELAQAAGQKYMVITTKHHDGFCMFDSRLTDYDVMNTPYHKDVLKMLTDACHQRGMRIGFYHSIMDWHHPEYLPRREWEKQTRPGDKADLNKYLAYMRGQLKELLTRYGEVACIWYDGGWEHKADELHSAEINAEIRRLQPQILINDRANTPEDFGTPEQFIPATGVKNPDGSPRLWEACLTMTSHWWGYDAHETNYKSTTDLIRTLVDVVSKGGNLLLNVGPRPDGTIQKEFVDRLYGIGAWLEVNGDSIYASTASPFRLLPFYGRCTAKGNRLYFHVFGWPADAKLRIPGLKNDVKSAWMVPSPESPLAFARDGGDVVLSLPAKPYDDAVSVVAVDLDGAPRIEPITIRPDAQGVIEMPAMWAEVRAQHSQKARHEIREGAVIVGNWTRTQDYVAWVFQCDKAGEYELELKYAAPAESKANKFEAAIGDNKITAQVEPTAGPNDFQKRSIGRIKCVAGENVLTIKAQDPLKGMLINLRAATLRPAH